MKFKIQVGKENDILRARSEEIRKDEIKKYASLGEDMVKYTKDPDNGGVGLAAPQIGVNKRLICVSLLKDYDDENFRTIYMINPTILDHSDGKECDEEGCLSVPGENGSVARWTWIKLSYLDGKGKEFVVILKGLSARIVQHELDHLDGVLFTDRLEEKILLERSKIQHNL